MKNKIIFGLIGEIASGKGTIAKYIQKKYKADVFRFSDSIREILDILGKKQSRKNMSNLGTSLRRTFEDKGVFTDILIRKANSSKNKIIIIDGIRHKDEIKKLRKLKNFTTVAIVSDPETRLERLKKRAENPGDKKKTYSEFLKDSKKPTEKRIPGLIKTADEKIINNTNIKNLYRQIDELTKKYEK